MEVTLSPMLHKLQLLLEEAVGVVALPRPTCIFGSGLTTTELQSLMPPADPTSASTSLVAALPTTSVPISSHSSSVSGNHAGTQPLN